MPKTAADQSRPPILLDENDALRADLARLRGDLPHKKHHIDRLEHALRAIMSRTDHGRWMALCDNL